MRTASQLTLVVALCAMASASWAQAAIGDTANCKGLEQADLSGVEDAPTQITRAAIVPSSADHPAYCRVEGYIEPNVGFEMWLPTGWNRKFLEIGCGGYCGKSFIASGFL